MKKCSYKFHFIFPIIKNECVYMFFQDLQTNIVSNLNFKMFICSGSKELSAILLTTIITMACTLLASMVICIKRIVTHRGYPCPRLHLMPAVLYTSTRKYREAKETLRLGRMALNRQRPTQISWLKLKVSND